MKDFEDVFRSNLLFKPKTPEDLSHHRLVAFGTAAALRLIKDDETLASFDPKLGQCQLILDDGHSHKIATCAGAGIAAHSAWSVHEELLRGELLRVLPEYRFEAETALWLMYPFANVLSAKVRVFMDFLIDRIGRQPAWTQ